MSSAVTGTSTAFSPPVRTTRWKESWRPSLVTSTGADTTPPRTTSRAVSPGAYDARSAMSSRYASPSSTSAAAPVTQTLLVSSIDRPLLSADTRNRYDPGAFGSTADQEARPSASVVMEPDATSVTTGSDHRPRA